MADRRSARVAALRDGLTAAHIDALVLTSLPNVRYLTGFSGTSALLLVTQRDVHFITDFRYDTQVRDEVGDLATIRIEQQSLWTGLWNLGASLEGVEIVGFESAHLLHRDFQRLLTDGTRWQWRPQLNLVEALRESKDADEVALIRRAGEIATRGLAKTLKEIRPGMSELNVAGILEHALRDEGSEEFPFPAIVASGPRAALPHARASSRVIERGDLLLLDFGAQYKGYCSDVTRTVVVGRASSEQREIYDIVKHANAVAASSVRAGMKGQDADGLARRYIEERGYGDAFGHSLGHGLGLEVHEAPRLAKTVETPLGTGAVVTIEPGIYRPGWGGVRIEDDVHLAASGPEILTDFTRELLEVA
ncbi:MAG: Xaa-Pro dipeptidase [Gemmatimonadetes bacterium]|nr:MAG: Xaa-Pro dipeptidase [Gemmatimonadota bacterium]PYP51830.1 MAG: Xaa-Pro dipeptidase [Gemmatimonadota bacterium]